MPPMLSTFASRIVTLHNGHPGLRTALQVEVRTAPTSSATLDFIASDETVDRYGEVLTATGWKLENYRRNPVFQNAHQYGDVLFTLGRALTTEIRQHNGRSVLFQTIEFATEVNPIAKITHGLYRGGFLKSVSVGFTPVRWEDSQGVQHSAALPLPSGEGRGEGNSVIPKTAPYHLPFTRRYLEQELLEVSAVAVPANPSALALGLKSGAIQQADLQHLTDLLRQTLPESNPPGHPTLFSLARQLRDVMRHT